MNALGSSLPVPHVQDLAASLADADSEMLERYIRSDIDPVANDDSAALPIIDLGRARLYRDESAKMGRACEEWGFFQLINHGVSIELVEKMKADIAEFFALPMEEKEKIAQVATELEGYGQIFVKSQEQKLDWGDMILLKTLPLTRRKMRFWPTNPPTFRDTLDAYTSAMKEVTSCLLTIIAENLGIDPKIVADSFQELQQAVRINYYPACPKAEEVMGLSPHSDATGLTVLLQAGDVEGLQIRNNGKWLPVKPMPGAFVVNIGDILEIFSNGKYKSVEHRAVVNTEKDRMSIATFHTPNHSCIVRPYPELVRSGAENYKSSSVEEYMRAYFSAKLDGKSHLESLKLQI